MMDYKVIVSPEKLGKDWYRWEEIFLWSCKRYFDSITKYYCPVFEETRFWPILKSVDTIVVFNDEQAAIHFKIVWG